MGFVFVYFMNLININYLLLIIAYGYIYHIYHFMGWCVLIV